MKNLLLLTSGQFPVCPDLKPFSAAKVLSCWSVRETSGSQMPFLVILMHLYKLKLLDTLTPGWKVIIVKDSPKHGFTLTFYMVKYWTTCTQYGGETVKKHLLWKRMTWRSHCCQKLPFLSTPTWPSNCRWNFMARNSHWLKTPFFSSMYNLDNIVSDTITEFDNSIDLVKYIYL